MNQALGSKDVRERERGVGAGPGPSAMNVVIHSIVPMTGTRVFTYPQSFHLSLISDLWNKD